MARSSVDDTDSVAKGKQVSRYRKVEVRTWGDERFRALSPMPPSGQGLWLFLITGPHTGPIPGLFRAGQAAMAEELGWDLEAFREAFREVFREGMAKADFQARVMWVPKAIKHNPPASPNVVKSWAAEFDLIPECDLKREAFEGLKASIHALGEAFGKAFDESFVKPSAKPFGKPSPKPLGNQEQEQEQEKEQDPLPSVAGGVGDQHPPDEPEPKPKRPAKKAPATFLVDGSLQAWARENVPGLDIRAETDKFRDHTFARAISDWPGAWRNWMRRAYEPMQPRNAQPSLLASKPAAPVNRQTALEQRNADVAARLKAKLAQEESANANH